MSLLRRKGCRLVAAFVLGFVVLGASLASAQYPLPKSVSISSTGEITLFPGMIGSNVWRADFETGNLSQFSSIEVDSGNLLEVTSTIKHAGSYGMHVRKEEGVARSMGIYEVSPVMYDFHFSFAFMGNFSANGWVRLLELRTEPGGKKLLYVDLYNVDGQLHFVGGSTSSFPINDEQWHKIDIFASSGKSGIVFIYLDGNPIAGYLGELDWTDEYGNPYYLGLIWIGHVYSGDGGGHGDLYYDDIKLDEWTPPEIPPQPPTPFFVYYPTTPEPNEEVTFYAYYSTDIDGNITSYSWDFGDSGIDEGMNVTHAFTSEGLYTVALTVTDNTDLIASITSKVLVETRTPVSAVGWALPLHTSGKTILDSTENNVTLNFTGVGKMGLEYSGWPGHVARESDPAYFESDTDLMRAWGIKFIRLGFNWKYYMTDYEYREVIKQFVDTATSKGIVIIGCVIRYDYSGYSFMPQFTQVPYDEVWRVGRDAILSLKAFAHDFLYNPMVVGVEINEFRPYITDPPYDGYDYVFRFELANELAQAVHPVNPNLLVGIEIHHDVYAKVSSQIKEQCRSLIPSNLVSMPHPYFTRDFGWNWIWNEYSTDPQQGKTDMYGILNQRFLAPQEYYNLPIVATEWGSQEDQSPLVINDEFDYFMSHNWGSSYWAWFRQAPNESPYGMGLLLDDWTTPSVSGTALKQKMAEYNFD